MITIKPQPCKGTGQAAGYGCGKLTVHRTYGLGKMCCYAGWLLKSEAGKSKMSKALIMVQKPRLELEKTQRQDKERTELKRAHDATKKVVHEYVRLRDTGKPCISCGEAWRPDFHAGHYHKSELFETLKYNLNNIHGQCPGCNIFKDGNLEKYSINLPLRIGQEAFNELLTLAQADKHFSKIWSVESLKAIRTEIKKL